MEEIWKPVKGYEGMYAVSSFGRIRTLPRKGNTHTGVTMMLKPSIGTGYYTVNLSLKNHQTRLRLHNLVAEVFLVKSDPKDEVNHIDGNRLNNHVTNLEYVSHKENVRHAFRIGLIPKQLGSKTSQSKFTDEQVKEIRKSKLSQSQIARNFNVERRTIWAIVNRKSYTNI